MRTQVGRHIVVTMEPQEIERIGGAALQTLATESGNTQALADLAEAVRARILPSWQDARDEGVLAWLQGQRFDGTEWITTLAASWMAAR